MSLSGQVPMHATYTAGGMPVGIDSRRRQVRVQPQTGQGPYNGGGVIRIDLPTSLGFLDTGNSYLAFKVKTSGHDQEEPVFMSPNCASWIQRLEIYAHDGTVLESIDDYNLLVNLLHAATSPDPYKNTSGKMLDNQGSTAERHAALATDQGKTFCCGFDASGLLGHLNKYVPIQYMSGSITIELQMASFDIAFQGHVPAGSPSPDYQIDKVEYVAEVIQFSNDYLNAFEAQLRSNGIDIAISSYRTHHHQLGAGGTQTLNISQNSKSLKTVYTIFRDKDKYRSRQHDSLSQYKSGKVKSYQFDLGARLYPEHPCKLGDASQARGFANMMNSWNSFRDQASSGEIGPSNYRGSSVATVTPITNYAKPSLKGKSTFQTPVIKRLMGTIYCAHAQSTTATKKATETVGGLFFLPDNAHDIKSIQLGDRVKVNLGRKNGLAAGSEAVALATDFVGSASDSRDAESGALIGPPTRDSNNKVKEDESSLFVCGIGPNYLLSDVFNSYFPVCIHLCELATTRSGATFKSIPVQPNQQQTESNKLDLPIFPDGTKGTATDVAALTIANAYGIRTSGGKGIHCALDVIPDDSKFFIAQSFEQHEEHKTIVSGSDMTQTTPLQLHLEFDATDTSAEGDANFNGDIVSSFLHYDSVIRIAPDGSVTSSM